MFANAGNLHHKREVLSPEEMLQAIDSVTADDVMRAAKRIFATTPTISTVGPGANIEPYKTFCARLQP
jgi:predicted Zn-dependent peptidase